MEALAAHGANSFRTWRTDNGQQSGQEVLDAAHAHGLMVTMGLEIARERAGEGRGVFGFDYDDPEAVTAQLERVRAEVMAYKDHPALLMWGIGNELNLGAENPAVWDAVNGISEMIHEVDGNHPTTTMLAGIGPEPLGNQFNAQMLAEALDVLNDREKDILTQRRLSDETITLEDAFAQSSNVAAVRLLGEVGSEKVIATARDLGVTSPLAKGDPSLALGTSTMTLLELTSAYAGVAANALPVEPHAFAREERGFFENLWDGPSSLSSSTRSDMEQMLRSAINSGTGRAAMLRGPNFGKTGTTQNNRDAVFVGYAGDLVVGVWIGNDDNSPLAGAISGGGLPARIWRAVATKTALIVLQVRTADLAASPIPAGALDLPKTWGWSLKM